jgi:adenylate kinase
MSKKLFLIIGAPGSGKTTDAEIIAEQNEAITHYSAGEMFRAEIATGSVLGQEIDKYVSNGKIVPIDIAIKTILGAIKNAPTEIIIIDGYPRSIEQMEELDNYLSKETAVQLVNVIEVKVSDEVARDRVIGRARGADDKIEVFNHRMEVYIEPLAAIQNFYNSQNILHTINGERSVEEVVEEMNSFILSQI